MAYIIFKFDMVARGSRGTPQASEAAPASAEAWRLCEGVRATVEQVSVLQGLRAADSVDSSVLQVRPRLREPGREQSS